MSDLNLNLAPEIFEDLILLPVAAASDLVTKGWYTTNFRQIRELVQDPEYQSGEVDPDEPVLEVVVGDANMKASASATPTFVRIFMDHENVGETSLQKRQPYNMPVWNERFLLLPRASFSTRFEVVDTWDRVLGHCTVGTQSLWRAAAHSGQVSVELPLQFGKGLSGKIWIHSRPWDGLPLPERPWWPRAQELHEDTWSPPRLSDEEDAANLESDDIVGSLHPEDSGKRRAKVLSGSDLFSRIDKDHTGSITRAEFEAALRSGTVSPSATTTQTQAGPNSSVIWPQPVKPSTHISAPQISMSISPKELPASGVLSQFAATLPPQPVTGSMTNVPLSQYAASMPPQPGDGTLGTAPAPMSKAAAQDLFAKLDKDGSGSISRAEFERALRQGELKQSFASAKEPGPQSITLPIGKSRRPAVEGPKVASPQRPATTALSAAVPLSPRSQKTNSQPSTPKKHAQPQPSVASIPPRLKAAGFNL
ncbi:unnamed protein product [Symbiodinium pilosum]|uniref:EF-hand domain-containing protein n=1 Tax=Symbiodinium pilosum TaxID=2952 RepID=A0A812X144_SYMPI|nr:unnamed protein product [Symbiodinium pilosum]